MPRLTLTDSNHNKHTLYNADCLKDLTGLSSCSVDMVLVDPPYGTTALKWDSILPFSAVWDELNRVVKPDGAMVFTANQPFTTLLISSNIKYFKYSWVWKKNRATGFLNSKKAPLRTYEDVVVFYRKQCTYNPQKTKGVPYTVKMSGRVPSCYGKAARVTTVNDGDRFPTNVVEFDVVQKPQHPTQKPVELMEYMIKTYTNEKETVLDFTMGSGTTGVACVNTNRAFIGMEINEEYFTIAKDRMKQASIVNRWGSKKV